MGAWVGGYAFSSIQGSQKIVVPCFHEIRERMFVRGRMFDVNFTYIIARPRHEKLPLISRLRLFQHITHRT